MLMNDEAAPLVAKCSFSSKICVEQSDGWLLWQNYNMSKNIIYMSDGKKLSRKTPHPRLNATHQASALRPDQF
jgi:hypothetical protein